MNRLIVERDLNAIFVTGPGHGGPGARRQHLSGGHLHRGLSAHRSRRRGPAAAVSPVLLSREASRATSRPRRRARSTRAASSATRCCTRTEPPSTTPICSSSASSATARPRPGRWPPSWHSNKFLNPVLDGAVLPILHLNGYKIANPTVLARIREARSCAPSFEGYGYDPIFVEGDRAAGDARLMAAALDERGRPRSPRFSAHARTTPGSPRPQLADDRPAHARRAGPGRRWSMACRSREPCARIRYRCRRSARTPSTSRSSRRGCARYRPEELFDADGALRRRARVPAAPRRAADERQSARQRWSSAAATSSSPSSRDYAVEVAVTGDDDQRGDARARRLAARRDRRQPRARSG